MNVSLEHEVRRRAYEMWLADGMTAGRDVDYWCAAERELLAADRRTAGEPARGRTRKARTARKRA